MRLHTVEEQVGKWKNRQRSSFTFETLGNVKTRSMGRVLVLPRIQEAGKNTINYKII